MAYSVDLRMKAVKHYLGSGHTFAQTGEIFGVGATTVRSWVVQYEETGDLSNKPLSRKPKKLDPDKLRAYVKDCPDATQQEIADEFGCCNQAVSKALKRLGITRKKNAPLQRARQGQGSRLLGNAGSVSKEKALLYRRIRL